MASKAKIVSNTIHLIGGPADGDTITVNIVPVIRKSEFVVTCAACLRKKRKQTTALYRYRDDGRADFVCTMKNEGGHR